MCGAGCGDGPQRLRGILWVLTVNMDEGDGVVDLGGRGKVRPGHEYRLRGGEPAGDRVPHELVPRQAAGSGWRWRQRTPAPAPALEPETRHHEPR